MRTAFLFSERSTCARIKAGAVIADGGHILSVGYNGNASGKVHCYDFFYNEYQDSDAIETISFAEYTKLESFKERHREWSAEHELHAEANAIIWAARRGIQIENADIYTTWSPCLSCTKNILQAGIYRVFYSNLYDRPEGLKSLEILKSNNVEVIQMKVEGIDVS